MTCTAHTYTHTHKHTYSEETEESLFHFTVVLFHILLESKIGGFPQTKQQKTKHTHAQPHISETKGAILTASVNSSFSHNKSQYVNAIMLTMPIDHTSRQVRDKDIRLAQAPVARNQKPGNS